MAINVSFNGATIYKPGAYSKISIDLSGGFPLGPVGLVAIFGESTRGRPGSAESDISQNVFTANQLAGAREKYGSGRLVDALNFLFAPASDGAIPGGAQAVYIYKTNASTQATLALASSYGTVRSLEFGIGGNTMTYTASATAEVAPSVASSAPFDETAVTATSSFDIYVDGKAVATQAVAGAYANNAALVADVGTWSVSDMSFSVSGSDGASVVTITRDADATANQKGWGKSIELRENTNTPLAEMSIAPGATNSSVEAAMTVTVKQTRDLLQEQDTVGGNVVVQAGYDGAEASPTIDVTATQVIMTAGASIATFDKAAYGTLLQLVNAMDLTADWSVSLASTLYNSLSPDVLDVVASIGAKTTDASTIKPARIKKDADEVADFFSDSSIVDIASQSSTGLMDAESETALAGGALGATGTADVTNALTAFESIRVNSVVPLFSRDAIIGTDTSSGDVVDNLTDSASTYTILGIHQAVKTHCNLMSTTKNRSERQGYLSYKNSFSASRDRSALMADARLQMAIQDVRNIDSQGTIKWFQPWGQAAMLAGARAGAPVGTPLTFKFFNLTGIRHTEQSMSTAEEDIVIDFNPNADVQQAIQNGITFFEAPQSGGIRCVVDNTTYQKDANFVYNRGNVMYAADVLAFDFRNQLENIFVGQKNTVQASEVKSVASSILATFLAQGITVATDEAPNGYKQLDVTIDGNVIRINAIVVLAEGIDFILNDITITRVQSEA
jgi:hypothetical protein